MKKVLCILFITALVAQICATPGGKDADKKKPDAKDKIDEAKKQKGKAEDEGKKLKDKAEEEGKKLKDEAEGEGKKGTDKAEDKAKKLKDAAKGKAKKNKDEDAKDCDDEAKKDVPKHHKHGLVKKAVEEGEGVVDKFADAADSFFDF